MNFSSSPVHIVRNSDFDFKDQETQSSKTNKGVGRQA